MIDDSLPPEVCRPLRDIAWVLRENNPSPDADAITVKQVIEIAKVFGGELIYITKLSASAYEYEQIRQAYANGATKKSLAEKHGVTPYSVNAALSRGKTDI